MAQFKVISTNKQWLSDFQKFLREMNNRYMTYLIGSHINDRLSINRNTFEIVIIFIMLNFLTIHKQ